MVKIGVNSHFTTATSWQELEGFGNDLLQVEAIFCDGKDATFICEIDDGVIVDINDGVNVCEEV